MDIAGMIAWGNGEPCPVCGKRFEKPDIEHLMSHPEAKEKLFPTQKKPLSQRVIGRDEKTGGPLLNSGKLTQVCKHISDFTIGTDRSSTVTCNLCGERVTTLGQCGICGAIYDKRYSPPCTCYSKAATAPVQTTKQCPGATCPSCGFAGDVGPLHCDCQSDTRKLAEELAAWIDRAKTVQAALERSVKQTETGLAAQELMMKGLNIAKEALVTVQNRVTLLESKLHGFCDCDGRNGCPVHVGYNDHRFHFDVNEEVK